MSKDFLVGIYLRLSREDERLGESSSITNQRAILMDYIEKNNLCYIDEYIDDGISGTTFDRVGFNRMIRDIKNGKINMIITKDTSRLGRDHIEFGYYVEKFFPEHNVRYVAVCDNIDTFYNNNDMLLFKSAYNDMYVKDISNKIRASLNIRKRNGFFVGSYAPYGYKKSNIDNHALIIDEVTSYVVLKIFSMFIDGYSISSIARKLTSLNIPTPSRVKGMSRVSDIWNTRTIKDILTNPTYMGNLTQGRNKKVSYKSKKRIHVNTDNWIVVNDSCPKIIDKNIFDMVQDIINSNKNRCNNRYDDILFKGMVYCYDCNHKISFRKVRSNVNMNIYGNCNYYLKYRGYGYCSPHNINYKYFEKYILDNLNRLFNGCDIDIIKNNVILYFVNKSNNMNKDKIRNIEKEINDIVRKIDKVYDDRLNDLITDDLYNRVYNKYNLELKSKKMYLDNIMNVNNNDNSRLIINKFFNGNIFDNKLIRSLIKKITFSEIGHIKVYLNIKNVYMESISSDSVTQ